MRQPQARRTGREALDQCYVYCWNTNVGQAVSQVKNGLEREGLSGLSDEVLGAGSDWRQVTVERRKPLRSKAIFLPLVLHKDGDGWRELDYQQHILPGIDWAAMDAPDPQSSLSDHTRMQAASVDLGDSLPVFRADRELFIDKTLSISYFARRLSDIVPNTWEAARIVRQLVEKLRAGAGSDDEIYDRRSYLVFALREQLADAMEEQAESVFRHKLLAGKIRFEWPEKRPVSRTCWFSRPRGNICAAIPIRTTNNAY